MNTVRLARFLMERFEAAPRTPDVDVGRLQEVFRHPVFTEGSEAKRRELMLESSASSYGDELAYPWDHYFGMDLRPLVGGAEALDLGCFNGGRSVAWSERYRFARLTGIDVAQVYIDAARQFADSKGVEADFVVAFGEALPFREESFDAILSFDVFEHVQDVEATLRECRRVLKPGGRLCVVFPGYWHPREHHLGLATRLPGIHYLFGGRTLVRAYDEIIEARGEGAAWYRRASPELASWERGNTINGTTFAAFRRLVRRMNWTVVRESKLPVGSIGRMFSRRAAVRAVSRAFTPLVHVPGIREFVLHRIAYVLERPS